MAGATLFLEPRGIQPGHLSQVALPTVLVLGKLGLAVLLIGFFAATFGAALETGLSCGYTIAQYFGFQWGKFLRPPTHPGST
jgi:manganese transport protein